MIPHEGLKAAEIHALWERVGDLEQQRASASNEAPDPGEGTSDVDSSQVQGWLPPANNGNDELA